MCAKLIFFFDISFFIIYFFSDRRILGDFLNFCPIISIDGSKMKPYDVNKMMSQLKKAQIEKVVQCGFEDGALYNDELLKLTDVELRDFDELKKAIGSTKAMAKTGDIDVNNQGFTNEQYAVTMFAVINTNEPIGDSP